MSKQPLIICQGADFIRTFALPGVSADAIVTAEIRRWSAGPLLARFSANVTPSSGTVTISLTETQTAQLTRDGVYDVEITNGAVTTQVASGPVSVRERVSTTPSPAPSQSATTWDDLVLPWDTYAEPITWETL